MSISGWHYRLYFFLTISEMNPGRKTALATIFSNNGSGESKDDEKKMFDSCVRMSITGSEPATYYALNTAMLPQMRAPLTGFVHAISQSRYYVVMNYEYGGNFAGELVESDDVGIPPIQPGTPPYNTIPFGWTDALADIFEGRGLIPILGGI